MAGPGSRDLGSPRSPTIDERPGRALAESPTVRSPDEEDLRRSNEPPGSGRHSRSNSGRQSSDGDAALQSSNPPRRSAEENGSPGERAGGEREPDGGTGQSVVRATPADRLHESSSDSRPRQKPRSSSVRGRRHGRPTRLRRPRHPGKARSSNATNSSEIPRSPNRATGPRRHSRRRSSRSTEPPTETDSERSVARTAPPGAKT